MLLIAHHRVNGGVLLKLKHELRAPDGDQLLLRTVRRIVRAGCRRVFLDLAQVTDVDAAGLGALVFARNHVHDTGGTIALLNPGQRVRRLLAMTKLYSVLNVVEANPLDSSSMRSATADRVKNKGPSLFGQPVLLVCS